MKKILFSFTTVLMLVLTSCGADPSKFNNSIVKQEADIEAPFTEYMTKAVQEIGAGSYDKVKVLGDSMLLKLDKSIEVIKALDTPKGGEKFKEASIQYFESAKEFISFINKAQSLGAEPTQEKLDSYYKDYESTMKTINEKTDAVLQAQREFAKEHNMPLI